MAGNVNSNVTVTTNRILQGSGKITVDGVDVGSYQGGVSVSWAQTELWVDSEWALSHVDSEIQKVTVQVKTELEEATLENLTIGWGLHSSSVLSGTSSKTLDLAPVKSMREVALVFQGMSATDRTKIRTFTLGRAVRIGTTEVKLNRGIKTTIPVSFECLLDSTGSFGSIKDNTI